MLRNKSKMKRSQLDKQFDLFLKNLKKDPYVIGTFLGGSRGKGFETKDSDYDLYVIVKDKNAQRSKKKYPRYGFKDIELITKSVSEFKKYAAFRGPEDWARYAFTHVKPIFDKSGRLQKILNEKGLIPVSYRKEQIRDFLYMYFNALYRSVKYHKTNFLASRFEAAESIRHLIGALFALEGRAQPYYGYLENELIKYPLKNLPWKPREFIKTISKILDSADINTQREVLNTIENVFRKKSYGKVFDSWQKLDLWKMVVEKR